MIACSTPVDEVDPLTLVREVREHPEQGPGRCDEAGAWAGECRVGWARVRLGDPEATLDELLPACGSDEECLFDMLDARPNPDLLAQLDLCEEHLGDTSSFCQQHAANRWLASSPDEEERLRVLAATGHDEVRHKALGHLVGCEGRGSCEGLNPGCASVVAMVQGEPRRCEVSPE